MLRPSGDRDPIRREWSPDVNSIPIYLKGETHYWSFGGVTNTGRGYFQATGHGYWKPQAVNPLGRVKGPPTGAPPRSSL